MENVNKQSATTGDYEHVGIGGVPDWMSHDMKGAATANRNPQPGQLVVFVNEPKSETVTLSGSEMKAMQADYENVVAELHRVSLENTKLKNDNADLNQLVEDDKVRLKASRKLRKSMTKDIAYLRAQLKERDALIHVFHKTNLLEKARQSANEADKEHAAACKELEKLKR